MQQQQQQQRCGRQQTATSQILQQARWKMCLNVIMSWGPYVLLRVISVSFSDLALEQLLTLYQEAQLLLGVWRGTRAAGGGGRGGEAQKERCSPQETSFDICEELVPPSEEEKEGSWETPWSCGEEGVIILSQSVSVRLHAPNSDPTHPPPPPPTSRMQIHTPPSTRACTSACASLGWSPSGGCHFPR